MEEGAKVVCREWLRGKNQLLIRSSFLVVSDSLQLLGVVHIIFQARIVEWVAISCSRGSSQPRDWTRVSCVSCIAAESYLLSHLCSQLLMAMVIFIFSVEDDYNFFKNWHSLCLHYGFPGSSVGKESACSARDPGLILGQEDPLEKEMANHSSILAWKISWLKEPGGLQSMGSQRVGHNWVTWATNMLTTFRLYYVFFKVSPLQSPHWSQDYTFLPHLWHKVKKNMSFSWQLEE